MKEFKKKSQNFDITNGLHTILENLLEIWLHLKEDNRKVWAIVWQHAI
jgi:hypothetical protein